MAATTNVRETSLFVFEQIKREGLLGLVQWKVYELIFLNGPLTAREITRHFEVYEGSIAITTYQPRLRELEELGVIRRVGERACVVTGRNAHIWDVSGRAARSIETAADKASKKDVPITFFEDKGRTARLHQECERLYNEGGCSEDFYSLVVFLGEQA